MGKYLIVDLVWEINFPQEFNQSRFEAFKTNDDAKEIHKINFEIVDEIKKLETTNYEEFGLKMYVENNTKLFDILNEQKQAIVRGKYINNTSTYKILKGEDLDLINILSFMRLTEIVAEHGVIALLASAVTMNDQVIIPIKDNVDIFINKWLEELDNQKLISNDKLFLKVENNLVKVYSNPWSKVDNVQNVALPMHSIVILNKGKKSEFIEINEEEKLSNLVYNLGIMTDTLSNEALMEFCIDLLDRVNIFKYFGNIDIKEIFNKIYFN